MTQGALLDPPTSTEMPALLAEASEAFSSAHPRLAMRRLQEGLLAIRRRLPEAAWRRQVDQAFRPHEVAGLLRQDPMTRRSCEKPRGYPGDATLLDLLYEPSPGPFGSVLGHAVYAYAFSCPAPTAVRWRRDYMTHCIDASARTSVRPVIISIGCGHMREMARSCALRERALGRVIGVDLDPESLAGVADTIGRYGVEGIRSSVRDLVLGRLALPPADLVYATGLFDYLADAQASALLTLLRGILAPGGELVIANFTPDLPDVGYMEAAMDWWLVYKTPGQLRDLIRQVARPGDVIDGPAFPPVGLAVCHLKAAE